MLRALWTLDAVCLLAALGLALFARGQDAAGQGMLWAFPLGFALALGASWAAERSGVRPLALGLAALGPALALVVALPMARSQLRARRESGGGAHWTDPAMRAAARAISAGDEAALRAATAAVADLDAVGADGTTLLVFAVRHRPAMVAPLLRLGADPNAAAPDRLTPLAQAVEAMDPAFDALLAGGADPNGPGDQESPVLFQAIRAGTPGRYRALLAHGADVTRLDARGRTTAMAAAEEARWAAALDLLARGADPAHAAPDGSTLRALVERRCDVADDPDYRALADRLAPRAAP